MSFHNRFEKVSLAVLAIVVAGFVTGCGVDADNDPMSSGQSGANATVANASGTSGNNQASTTAPPTATKREAGVIRVEGKSQGSLTSDIAKGYENTPGSSNVQIDNTGENEAFSAFCAGKVDVVDSARPISPNEFQKCNANGIQPVQIQIASDAAILAIKNETDVGVDCLSFNDVQDIYKSGSDINSWSQVGYNRDLVDVPPIRLKTVGPNDKSNVFGFLGQYVLGDPEPTELTVRSDYQAEPTDREVRQAVVGDPKDYRNANGYEGYKKALKQLESAISDGKQRLSDAQAEVAKGIRDKRPPAAKQHDQNQLHAAEKNLAKLKADLPPAKKSVKTAKDAQKRVDSTLGTLGLFRFSYYELFEEQLRPMEVSSSDDASKPECVFPSQATVTNGTYPLARQLLLTVNYKNLQDSDINDFLSYGLQTSQHLAEQTGLVPIPDATKNEQQSWLDGTSQPDVVFYKNTSSNK
jgi:ABC-type phosphate transport system substrate-binding protein